jgi:uncharacterized protein YwqG
MLYFFYDLEKRPSRGERAVLYYDGDMTALMPSDFEPKTRFAIIDYELALGFEADEYDPTDDDDADDDDDDGRDVPEGYNAHFLLGTPTDPEQMGLGSKGPPDDWQLVLQIDSFIGEEAFGFGDDGYLCYFVKKADFAKRNFKKSWFLLALN